MFHQQKVRQISLVVSTGSLFASRDFLTKCIRPSISKLCPGYFYPLHVVILPLCISSYWNLLSPRSAHQSGSTQLYIDVTFSQLESLSSPLSSNQTAPWKLVALPQKITIGHLLFQRIIHNNREHIAKTMDTRTPQYKILLDGLYRYQLPTLSQ